jgi:hypothetical protein
MHTELQGMRATRVGRNRTRAMSLLRRLSGRKLVSSEGLDMAVIDDLGDDVGLGGVSGTVGVGLEGAVPLEVEAEEASVLVLLSGSAARHLRRVLCLVPAGRRQGLWLVYMREQRRAWKIDFFYFKNHSWRVMACTSPLFADSWLLRRSTVGSMMIAH